MKILLVDDEPGKRQTIVNCLHELCDEFNIIEACSFESAIRQLRQDRFDWVVLDMRITTFDISTTERGGRPRNLGGEEILRKMARRNLQAKVVVVTQYSIFRDKDQIFTLDELGERLRQRYSHFVGLVQLSHSSDAWKENLKMFLSKEIS